MSGRPDPGAGHVVECRRLLGEWPCPCCGQKDGKRACERHGWKFCRACFTDGCGAMKPTGTRYEEMMRMRQESEMRLTESHLPPVGAELTKVNLVNAGAAMSALGWYQSGSALMDLKHICDHGRWLHLVETHTVYSVRSAQKLMQISGHAGIRELARLADSEGKPVLPGDREVLLELARLSEEQFDSLIKDGVIHADMKRGDARVALTRAETPEPPALPKPPADGKYGAILADPPWPWEPRGNGGKGRSPEVHYPTMTVSEISDLPVGDLAARHCALFLWTTSTLLPHAQTVMQAWGFRYVTTAFVWVKEGAPGLGYWTRKQTELCLLGVRRQPKRLNADVPEAVFAPRGRHSEKPAEVRERIMRLVAGPYVELFARDTADGWDSWGQEVRNDQAKGE